MSRPTLPTPALYIDHWLKPQQYWSKISYWEEMSRKIMSCNGFGRIFSHDKKVPGLVSGEFVLSPSYTDGKYTIRGAAILQPVFWLHVFIIFGSKTKPSATVLFLYSSPTTLFSPWKLPQHSWLTIYLIVYQWFSESLLVSAFQIKRSCYV